MLKISRAWFEKSLKPRLLHQSLNYLGPCNSKFYIFEQQLSLKIDLTLDFASNYHGKGRNEINRAVKQGVRFEVIQYDEFLELSRVWARLKRLKPGNDIYLSEEFEMFCTKTSIASDYLSAHAYILSSEEKSARLLYSVTNLSQSRTLTGLANRMNHHKDFELFSTKGFKFVDLGGIGPETPGITAFKRSFGGKEVINVNAYSLVLFLLKRISRR